MKIIVSAAVAALLALGACSQAEDKAAEPASASNAAPVAAAAPAAAPAATGLAKGAFVGLPQSCQELADKMDHLRGCVAKAAQGQLSAAEIAATDEQSRQQAVAMATDLRALGPEQAAEACTANHEMMDQMKQAMAGDC
jgi:hypothetical protein